MQTHTQNPLKPGLCVCKRPAQGAGILFSALLSLTATLFSTNAPAQDSCGHGQSKKGALCVEVTGGVADPNSREAKWARGEITRPMTRARYWDFVGPNSTHIMQGECWAVSPTVYIGRLNQLFFFASVSVGGTWDAPRVIVQSEAGLENAPTKFHAYRQKLGLWTETMPFQTLDRELGEHDILLGFNPRISARIVDNLARMLSFQLRLRFAPVDKAFDSPTITLNGFVDAFKQADACNRALK